MQLHSVVNMPVQDRMKVLKTLADVSGLRLPTTILPEGHAFWDVGEENKRRLQAKVDNLPWLADALTGLEARITQEDPKDVAGVQTSLIRMSPQRAGLYAEGKNPDNALGYTHSGFSHIAQFIKPNDIRWGFTENMLALAKRDKALAAQVFNTYATRVASKDNVTLRTMLEPVSGVRVIRAVTSSKHSLETGDDLAVSNVLRKHIMGGALAKAKARITRELDHSYFECIWPAMERQLVVGDIALIGVRISNSETKAGSLRVEAFVLRVLCANFATAYSEDMSAESLGIKHVGDLRTKLPMAFTRALERVIPFVEAFSDAYQNPLPAFAPTYGEVLSRVSKRYNLPESTINLASQLWDADGERSAGLTLAGLVNSLTRASQEESMEQAAVTERVAGELTVKGWDSLA
jgi:hypothetical protein